MNPRKPRVSEPWGVLLLREAITTMGPSLAVRRSLSIAVCFLLVGCAEEPSPFTETRKPDQVILPEEWAAFQRIIEALPASKLIEMPAINPPLPNWIETRSLPVNELVAEEQKALAEAWNLEVVLPRFEQTQALQRALDDERMSFEQFVGVTLTVSAAMLRAQLADDFDFEDFKRGINEDVVVLQRDRRLYSAMTPDARHQVLRDAISLHRLDRMERLSLVPPENVLLIREHKDFLAASMHPRYRKDPLDDVKDLLTELGLPFVEKSGSGSDDHLEWDPAEAIGGQ